MKIGILLYTNIVGGAETVSLELANMLKSVGHEVFFIFAGVNLTEGMGTVFDQGTPFTIYENTGKYKSAKGMIDFLASTLNKEKPSIIISGFLEESYILLKARKYIEKDFKIIMINHSGSFHKYEKFWDDRAISVYNQAKAFVTVIKLDQLYFEKILNVPVVTIPNMPRLEFYSEINPFTNNARGKKIFSLGRLAKSKGFDILIRAFSKIKSDDWTLHIYGEGSEQEFLENLILTLNMDKKIFLYPATKEVAKVMNEHEFFVLPSLVESYGMVLLESLMMGLPCISFDCPRGPAVIESELPGSVVLVPNGDENALGKEIEILIHNEDRRKELSTLAINYRKLINREKNIDTWDKLLNEP